MTSQERTALLVMDVQRNIVERYASDPGLLDRIGDAIAAARSRQVPIVYVVVQFRSGFPEVSSRNKSFSALASSGASFADPSAAAVHPAIAPAEGDVTVVKRRVSAFTGSDLEVVLRARAIEHVVLCGIATSGVVLSTLREAADRDYRITVLADCCTDGDDEVHRVLTQKVFPRQAEVLTAREWIAGLQHGDYK
ncbi:MAG TPA: isochorismatase family cysteine hydrolase [Candidatus Baltobacteraceae bacterium]|jgi:nicotinamidase-related amidase|nr:isochorismatase family cysteine hydrolase [Candidatus Baltobacteraceae bacterium]